LETFPEETAPVQLQLLTATVKLFLKKPTEVRAGRGPIGCLLLSDCMRACWLGSTAVTLSQAQLASPLPIIAPSH